MADETEVATRTIYHSAKPSKWEAIEIGEVDRRIRATLPDLPEGALKTLAFAVVMSVPPPSELGNHLTNAVAALEGVRGVFAETAANEGSRPLLKELRDELFSFIGALQTLRDRAYRVCDHRKLEKLADGSSICVACKSIFPEVAPDQPPGRLLTPRAFSPLVEGKKPPGKAAFFYLATEICREHGMKKLEAMKAAAELLDLFWQGGVGYEDEQQMESAHREGRKSAKRNRFLAADDVGLHPLWGHIRTQLIWVPYRPSDEPAE